MTIQIIDANNTVRRLLENDVSGLAPRTILSDVSTARCPVVYVWDGRGGNARRRKVYDNYKRNRKPLKGEIVSGFQVIKEVLEHSKAIQVEVPGYEADDVVATLASHYADLGEDVEIHSTDMDFLQLSGRYPGKVFCGCNPKVEPHLVRYYKLTVGDSSDNIPGIAGFGQKTWDDTSKEAIVGWVDDIITRRVVRDIGLPPRVHVDIDDMIRFSKIIDFFDVPLELISNHMTVGSDNYAAADAYLKRFLQ